MRKYHYRRELLIFCIGVLPRLLAGCDHGTAQNDVTREYPAPELISFRDLVTGSNRYQGARVGVNGVLKVDSENNYYIVANDETDTEINASESSVSLVFSSNNVDIDKITRCVGMATIVTGYVEQGRTLRAEYVNLKEDVENYRYSPCYEFYQ